jgi:predicted nucleic acid-binding protein
MNVDTFVDTNILIYAYDTSISEKHLIAQRILESLWITQNGIVSTQVLQEFYVNVTQKMDRLMSPEQAHKIVKKYILIWRVHTNTPETILLAFKVQMQHKLSFWDALIMAAAIQSNAKVLLTEDLNHGQIVEGITIQNPFKTD